MIALKGLQAEKEKKGKMVKTAVTVKTTLQDLKSQLHQFQPGSLSLVLLLL
jgi:hypothetical protein